ncbi:uncharacterized protein LOC143026279 [Oratosquilla oratoria]|uniref:uncharacterized protein LOC143026279 n=1 Tax=Oratosquilla oratoria TaxID=337810 RepID=UPI003F773691
MSGLTEESLACSQNCQPGSIRRVFSNARNSPAKPSSTLFWPLLTVPFLLPSLLPGTLAMQPPTPIDTSSPSPPHLLPYLAPTFLAAHKYFYMDHRRHRGSLSPATALHTLLPFLTKDNRPRKTTPGKKPLDAIASRKSALDRTKTQRIRPVLLKNPLPPPDPRLPPEPHPYSLLYLHYVHVGGDLEV